jgi:nucleoid-associated protein YgaU
MKTKTIMIAFALVFVAAFSQAGAESFFGNEYATKAIELEELAQYYFDAGEYDLAAEKAQEAYDNWVYSDQYVEDGLREIADEETLKSARLAAEREAADAEAARLADEQRRLEEEEAAKLAAEQQRLDEQERLALEEAEKARLEEEEAARLAAELQRLEDEDAARLSDAESEAAKLAAEQERLAAEEAARLAAEESGMQALKTQAEEALKKAKDRLVWAESLGARQNYPKELDTASMTLYNALTAYDAADYIRAKWYAEDVLAALAKVQESVPLPAIYVVRLIPERRDCFWRIAGYPFIYNDPTQWPKIYEANKSKIQDPNNPDLIQPGQRFVIPSLKGEVRSGEWDPAKQYKPLN